MIACGALAHDMVKLKESLSLDFDIACVPAQVHWHCGRIVSSVEKLIDSNVGKYQSLFVMFGDCGTNGALDALLEKHGVTRIGGEHCYRFYAGDERFSKLSAENPLAYFVTDFMIEHFEGFVMKPLKMDVHPELIPMYFGNYATLMHISHSSDVKLIEKAREIASMLKMEYLREVVTNYDYIESFLKKTVSGRVIPITNR